MSKNENEALDLGDNEAMRVEITDLVGTISMAIGAHAMAYGKSTNPPHQVTATALITILARTMAFAESVLDQPAERSIARTADALRKLVAYEKAQPCYEERAAASRANIKDARNRGEERKAREVREAKVKQAHDMPATEIKNC